MPLPKHYHPQEAELRLSNFWQQAGIYHFTPGAGRPVYSIDTPPPTVSGNLHLGHTFSYTHPDIFARFWRMNGSAVFYPIGFDDNGLPTERLVEKTLGVTAVQLGRTAFIDKCLQTSSEVEAEYRLIFTRLGLSIDWRHTYSTIDEASRRIAQLSFIELYRKGLAYREEAPSIWCPECHTALSQADLNDLERPAEFVTLAFRLASENVWDKGVVVPVATTRPELLSACVAAFINPQDSRYQHLDGKHLVVPVFGQTIPVLFDPAADPDKGTGIVMCCTFGDTADATWWKEHHLPYIAAVDRNGCLTAAAGPFAGLAVPDARREIKQSLQDGGLILGLQPALQTIRIHERCDTPVEIMLSPQWFINILEHKERLLALGEQVSWHPPAMQARYQAWVSNLHSDWCISRQRYFGVPFPLWYCQECGRVNLADEQLLPVDPQEGLPSRPCACGSTSFLPENDILDTWATSSMTPQIAGGLVSDRGWFPERSWSAGPEGFEHAGSAGSDISESQLYEQVFPFSLRPQAHDIIRTWAFYTILKSEYHFSALPWKDVLISGWGVAGEGMGKISKSRGGGPMPPMEMISRYSADALRYWASSTGPGKDAVISEAKIQLGVKLITKLWNVARFSEPFLEEYFPSQTSAELIFTSADRWILARTQALIRRVSELLREYEYAAAKNEIESFFWRDLSDNYLEMCKQRLYGEPSALREGAINTLHSALLVTLKLLAPFLPFVSEEIYLALFAASQHTEHPRLSIHLSPWPLPDPNFEAPELLPMGEALISLVTSVRRYKSEHSLPLASQLEQLQLVVDPVEIKAFIEDAIPDLASACRVSHVLLVDRLEAGLIHISVSSDLALGIKL